MRGARGAIEAAVRQPAQPSVPCSATVRAAGMAALPPSEAALRRRRRQRRREAAIAAAARVQFFDLAESDGASADEEFFPEQAAFLTGESSSDTGENKGLSAQKDSEEHEQLQDADDSTGTLNGDAKDEATGKAAKIPVTNDRARLPEEQTREMFKEAEQSADADTTMKERADAKIDGSLEHARVKHTADLGVHHLPAKAEPLPPSAEQAEPRPPRQCSALSAPLPMAVACSDGTAGEEEGTWLLRQLRTGYERFAHDRRAAVSSGDFKAGSLLVLSEASPSMRAKLRAAGRDDWSIVQAGPHQRTLRLLEELIAGGATMRAAATALDALAKEVQQDATLVLRAGRQQDAKAMVTDAVSLARTALAFP